MLNQDYKDILSIFSNAGIDYLLVGAYALAVHGLPRATGDMDLWIRREDANAKRLIKALKVFGAPLTQIAEQDFLTEGIVYQIGVAPRRIDILTSIEGANLSTPGRNVSWWKSRGSLSRLSAENIFCRISDQRDESRMRQM